jgi:hypothetical protein
MCDLNHCFQNAEVTKLPWIKFIVGANGRVHKVTCKICRKMKGHNKLLVLKLTFLWKHVGQRKATTTILNVVAMGEYYFLKINQHVYNESLYVSRGRHYVVQQVVARIVVKGKYIYCLFCIHFHLHSQGRLMTEKE